MLKELESLEERYLGLEKMLSDPQVIKDFNKYHKLVREHSELRDIIHSYRKYKDIIHQIHEHQELLSDKDQDIRELAKAEIQELKEQLSRVERELRGLLLPKDSNDEKNIFLEIRAGAGGEEASLFVTDLFRMYSKYAEMSGWKVDIINSHPTGIGGFKEIIALIEGKGVYGKLKFEKGVHRVQRVPVTETQGRIHTSTVTVAVLPEAEEVEVHIDPSDIRVDVFRSSGPGGQSVNTTDSAVRITHLPSGIVVTCQDERSQHKNKAKALKVLRARLLDMMREEQEAKISQDRKNQVGTGDRSERIRTYNFPQRRVTDHRIGLTLYKLESVLEGNLSEIIDALTTHYQTKALKAHRIEEVDESKDLDSIGIA
ncbi:MAG TPA: peptide chain release factor 1 [Syntrophaceae bacterium]|nr:peptide chain release factor 1 [Syntrophaceae bacterium]